MRRAGREPVQRAAAGRQRHPHQQLQPARYPQPSRCGKSYILASLLAHCAAQSAPADIALFVTSRRHRHSALEKLRNCLPPETVWILDGLSETDPAADTHLSQAAALYVRQALRAAHESLYRTQRSPDLSSQLDDPDSLLLHTLCLRILFVEILWQQGACREHFYKKAKVVVATGDLSRKAFQTATPHWARDRRLQVLVHDGSSFRRHTHTPP